MQMTMRQLDIKVQMPFLGWQNWDLLGSKAYQKSEVSLHLLLYLISSSVGLVDSKYDNARPVKAEW